MFVMEDCPICFDIIENNSNRINCPDCKKHIHKECMDIWLSRNKTCVFCRSTMWKYYDKCFIQNKKTQFITGFYFNRINLHTNLRDLKNVHIYLDKLEHR